MEFEIYPKPPFDFDLSLKYYSRSKFESVDVVDECAYYRVIPSGRRAYPVKVISVGTVERPKLQVKIYKKSANEKARKMIRGYLRTAFRADYELAGFYRFCRQDSVLRKLTKQYYGLKNPLTVDPFEILVWAITGQQMSLNFAYKLKRRLVLKYGREYEIEGHKVYLFPEPEALADASREDLMEMQYSRNKADYIRGLAELVCKQKIELEKLRGFDDNRVREILTGIRGVGSWSSEYCMLRSLGRDDACPAGDAGLRRALALFYGLNNKARENEVEDFMERFRLYRGMVTYYLWFGLLESKTRNT
jgi:DNA-3-methyladenine glycosylase II